MKREKKDRPKVAAFEQSRPGLSPRTISKNIISLFGEKSSLYLGPPRGLPRGERRKEWS